MTSSVLLVVVVEVWVAGSEGEEEGGWESSEESFSESSSSVSLSSSSLYNESSRSSSQWHLGLQLPLLLGT